jgi:hypothetical protein
MKGDMRKFLAVAPLFLLACCVAPEKAPPPVPQAPPPPPPPPPAPVSQDWRDWPLTPGTWIYQADAGGTSALFGRAGGEAALILRCDRATRTVILSWPGVALAGGNEATITTSHGSASYRGLSAVGVEGRIGITFPANNPFLDKLAFSQGRFVVASAGIGGTSAPLGDRLVVPAWPEPARAVEDCRK